MNGPNIQTVKQRSAHTAPAAALGAADLAETLAAMLVRDSVEAAAGALADRLPARLGNVRMAVATCTPGRATRLQAVTGVGKLDRRSELVRSFEAALDEAVLQQDAVVYARSRRLSMPAKTHEHLGRQLGCGWIISSPLRNRSGRIVGAWLVWGDAAEAVPPAAEVIETAERPIAAALETIVRANEGVLARARRSLASRLDSRRKRRLILATAASLAGLALLPMPYKLRCGCTIEPVVRRFVAAPFDAPLEKSLVEPGDVVRAGEPLATLDGRELRWNLAALEADYAQAQKSRDAALADRNPAAAQLARLEIERLENRIQLLRSREDQLEIKCPLDGVVVSGDLHRVEGAPLTVGQTLLEIAPLERVIVEVAVAETDIGYVEQGETVDVRLDAFPHRRYREVICRIHPQAELRDNEQVFIAEVELRNDDAVLRPGMVGRAKVRGPWSPLAWIVFHRPVEAAARWVGW